MSLNIKKADGSLQKIAGNTVILDASTADIRSGTFTLTTGSQGSTANATITFDTPFPTNDDYIVTFTENTARVNIVVYDKTASGFKVVGSQFTQSSGTTTITYTAARLINLDGYTELQNKVNNPDTEPTAGSTNLVESGGVYEALQNVESSFIGTRAEWDVLTSAEKEKYTIVNFTDDINSNGSEIDKYSTDEIKTNKVWIDGKPIYRKVFYINNPVINWTRTSLNVYDIDWIVKHEYTAKRTNGAVITKYYRSNSDNYEVHLLLENGTLNYYCQSNSALSAMSVTVEYTKTTD